MATKLILIRHAEKPDDAGRQNGLDASGRPDPRGLTVRGWQRAGALVRWLAPRSGVSGHPHLARPDAILAVAPHPWSERATLTIQPLAALMKLTVNQALAAEDVDGLLRALAGVDGVALACWRHNSMGAVAHALCPQMLPVPDWDVHCFDQAWVFDKSATGWSMTRVAQELLPGDSP